MRSMLSGRGSSPLTRGAPVHSSDAIDCQRIIPAYAGSTDSLVVGLFVLWDHPRLRGEHRDSYQSIDGELGSSPLTRGARLLEKEAAVAPGIIPAYAGSTRTRYTPSIATKDHPRLRGEHALMLLPYISLLGSSPLTRGALSDRSAPRVSVGIIPAYAGSTSTRTNPESA